MNTQTRMPLPADGAVDPGHGPLPTEDLVARGRTASGAVIIPAHDEAAVIGRTLRSLSALAAMPGIEVIVVCNGCSDHTAAAARRFPDVRVVEISQPSKIAALNAGDRLATEWPRMYLDADIEVSPDSVLAVFDALAEPGVLAARPFYFYDTTGASAPVRSYYRARSRIPAPASRLWGAGGYAVSREGHDRFGEFADVTADDSWFDGRFADDEKRVVAALPMRVRTPRDLRGLLAVLTRQRRGYVELGIPSHARTRGRALLSTIHGPRSAIDMAWYAGLTVVARRRSERALRRAQHRTWERDGSSRTTDAAANRPQPGRTRMGVAR